MVIRFISLICLCLLSIQAQAQVFDIAHGEEEPTRTLLIGVKNPKALVLLYPGGSGLLRIQSDGGTKNKHTFIRSADLWAKYRINAVLVDTPYDLGDLKRGDLRGRKDHLQRVREVVGFYQEKTSLPVWIFGHSMGTATATNYANESVQLTKSISGIIIAGTIRTASLSDEVTVPILAVHHRQDECNGTPVSASERIISGRSMQVISRLEITEGGISEGNVCESFAYHGFNQTEAELVKLAAQFILSN